MTETPAKIPLTEESIREQLWQLCVEAAREGLIKNDADFYGIFAGFIVSIHMARGGKAHEVMAQFQNVLFQAVKALGGVEEAKRIIMPEEKKVVNVVPFVLPPLNGRG